MTLKMKWWVLHVVHNCIAHPLLVVAEASKSIGFFSLTLLLYRFHDATIAPHDAKNLVKLL
jgi:hypothetical protein